jgi:ribosomal protein L40E
MEMAVITFIAVIAFAAVLYPLFRRAPRDDDEREFGSGGVGATLAPSGAGAATSHADALPPDAMNDIEREVLRYRTAVRAGTVCRKCGQANPADSRFCFECGAQLARADAKEFE